MQQGSNAGAGLAARTAGMTDEQILDLDLAQFAAAAPEIAPEAAGEPDLWEMPTAAPSFFKRAERLDEVFQRAESFFRPGPSAHRDFFRPGKRRDAHGLSRLDKRNTSAALHLRRASRHG